MDLITLTRELGKKIQESDEYINLNTAKEKNDNDTELQDLISSFNLKRVELNTLMAAENKDAEKTANLNQELQDLYQKVMTNENMNSFNSAKNAVDLMMNKITNILMKSINGEDPMTCAEVDESCGGSCSSCSGCH